MNRKPFYLIIIVLLGVTIFTVVTRKDDATSLSSPTSSTTDAAGLQATDAPWQPEKSKLTDRLATLLVTGLVFFRRRDLITT